MLIPKDLRERTESAIRRISSGQAPMRVPVDPTDPDVVLAEWLRVSAELPPAGGEIEVLAVVALGGYFSSEELGNIDIQPRMAALEQIQQDVVRTDADEHLELVDRAHVIRLQAELTELRESLVFRNSLMGRTRAEREALQQRLNIADQKINDLEHAQGQCLEVNPTSLRALLVAVTGAPHEIREIQACRGIPDNPIDQLLREYNDWVYAPAPPAGTLDASMIGIVHTPPMEYDEP